MMSVMGEYFLLISVLIVILYYWLTYTFNHWKNLGVPGPRPLPLVGNFGCIFMGQTSLTELTQDFYNNWKHEPFFGVFRSRTPILFVNDLDLVRHILIKDFHIFSGRGIKINQESEPLSEHLFNLDGHQWKVIRAKLSPAFTTGKLKQMVTLMVECSNDFEKYLLQNVCDGDIVECREAAAKFTTDVIGSCAFGISMNACSNDDSEFRSVGRAVFRPSFYTILRFILRESSPFLYKLLRFEPMPKKYVNFFINTIKETMDVRDEKNITRHDLVDILRDMKKNQHEIDFELTDNLLTAQAFVFFVAGFETSSTTISFALYELAQKEDIQQKLRNEIFNKLNKYNGRLSYESINEMQYLNMVIQETLRKNSPGVLLRRVAMEPYNIPDTNVTIPKGTIVQIPVYSIHHDERHHPDPEVFDPERFSENNQTKAFLPFGDGPKNCIGARFATYQSKLGLISILRHFKVKPSKFTQVPYKIDKGAIVLSPVGGVRLEFQRIK